MPIAKFFSRSTDGKPGGSPIIDQVIADVDSGFRSIGDVVNNAVIVTVTFTGAATDTRAIHRLGHPPLTWEVVDRDANINVWRSPTVNSDAKNTMLLQASGAGTAKIRFT